MGTGWNCGGMGAAIGGGLESARCALVVSWVMGILLWMWMLVGCGTLWPCECERCRLEYCGSGVR
jgi:hypothetical protein